MKILQSWSRFSLVALALLGLSPAVRGQAASASLTVNAALQHAISPYIYGMNFADQGLAAELRLPVNRWGGNATTRYNWQNNTANHASDWYFENIPNDSGATSASDLFVEQNRATGTQTILTIPLIGWTPKGASKTCGFSVKKYGAQQDTDPYQPNCGNGIRTNGSQITGNDPADISTAIGPTFVQDWMRHLIGRYGTADAGGVRFYNLDNETALWNSTHRDVHPQPVSYDELRDRTEQYAPAVKAVDPLAQTLGPVAWGWDEYFYSAKDEAPGGSWWDNPLDRKAHGGVPLVEWYLQQMAAYEKAHGVRILDYLDLHYYPQADGVALKSAGNASTQALRQRSTRSLWDASYTDESWIAQAVNLIPAMRSWVNKDYPGTRLAISEYNWGALDHINGAVAQADVLGIFGREGLDLATLWSPPKSTDPGAFAFRMYRNYDGAGGSFGETGVAAASWDQSQLSIYAAVHSFTGELTVMVINKTQGNLTVPLALANFSPGSTAQVYRYSSANLAAIQHLSQPQSVTAGQIAATYPAQSITLFVLPTGVPPKLTYLPRISR